MSPQTSTFTRVSRATRGQRVTAISRFARTISRAAAVVLPAILQRAGMKGIAFAGPGYITLALEAEGVPAGCPVNVYDARTGELLADGHTAPGVGLLTFTRLPHGLPMRVVAAHASGRYEADVWDGIETPTSFPPLLPFPPPESVA